MLCLRVGPCCVFFCPLFVSVVLTLFYSLFYRLRVENPTLDFAGLGQLLGSTWKSLTEDDKVKFVEKADADKIRYIGEMALSSEGEDRARAVVEQASTSSNLKVVVARAVRQLTGASQAQRI